MEKLLDHITSFLERHTIWMFVTAILLLSILLLEESEPRNWGVYLHFLGIFTLLYLPLLAFSLFRSRLKERLSHLSFRILWALAFIIYPFLLVLISQLQGFESLFGLIDYLTYVQNEQDAAMAILSALGLMLFVVEAAIQSNAFLKKKAAAFNWIKKLGLEKTILISMLIFSAFIMTVDYTERYDFPQNFNNLISGLPRYISHIFQFFLIILIYYGFYLINHYLLINRILKRSGIVYYAFSLLGTVLLLYPIAAQLIAWIPMVRELRIHPVANVGVFAPINVSIPLVGMLLSIPFILSLQWFKQSSEIATLGKEKAHAELGLLKQQINPHFFFNTLNNLYALSIKKDMATPEVIMRLSELMRYVIYRGKEEEVQLKEEVKYIEDYIHLQQIRLYKKLDYQFEKDIEDDRLLIPPLLFIILVENAFKHGIEPAENEGFLHLHLKTRASRLSFCCLNSFEEKKEGKPGIGLENLRKRLDLLFPNHYQLSFEQNDFTYKALLEIHLA